MQVISLVGIGLIPVTGEHYRLNFILLRKECAGLEIGRFEVPILCAGQFDTLIVACCVMASLENKKGCLKAWKSSF